MTINEMLEYIKWQLQEYQKVVEEQQEKIDKLEKENKRLKNGYCELKVKCNNGECDCTNEEYDGMVQANMKLFLENERLKKYKKYAEDVGNKRNELYERIDNTIKEIDYLIGNCDISDYQGQKLLQILQGEDDE